MVPDRSGPTILYMISLSHNTILFPCTLTTHCDNEKKEARVFYSASLDFNDKHACMIEGVVGESGVYDNTHGERGLQVHQNENDGALVQRGCFLCIIDNLSNDASRNWLFLPPLFPLLF